MGGKRRIENIGDVLAYTWSRFSHVANVNKTKFRAVPMVDQLRLVATTTVAISPCGGISMILPFLPVGGFAILMNFMAPDVHGGCGENCSWTMDAELWRHVPYINKLFYQVFSGRDCVNGLCGRHKSIVVDVERLGQLVTQALHSMEPF